MLSSCWSVLQRFAVDARGTTAIEYALIAGAISLAIIVIVSNLGGTLNTKFSDVKTSLQ